MKYISILLLALMASSVYAKDTTDLNKDSTNQVGLLPWGSAIADEVNDDEHQTLACTGAYPVGNIYQERVKTTTTDIAGYDHVSYSAWTETSRNCRVNKVDTQNVACPANQTGTHIQQRTYTLYYNGVIADDTGWVTTSNSCAYYKVSDGSETQNVACPANQTGTHTKKRTYENWSDGTKKNYSAWTTITNTCNYFYTSTGSEYQYLGCSAGYTGTITQSRTYQNYSDGSRRNYSGWSTVGNTCTPNIVCRYSLWGPITVIQEFKSFVTRYFLQINGENVLSNVTLSQLEAYGVTKGKYRDTNPTGAPDFYEVCGPAYLFN